jgi:transposase
MGKHTGQHAFPVRCTMEATGIYHEKLALLLHEEYPEVHLSVVLPTKAKRYLQSLGYRNKTDKIDAQGSAERGAHRRLARWKGIDPFWRRLRELTRTKAELVKQRTATTNKLHAHRSSGVQIPEVVQLLEDMREQLAAKIDKLDRLIAQHLRSKDDYQQQIGRLLSIPGIGIKTAAVILAETMGFTDFTSKGQLISFSGYDVAIRESGQWKGQQKISKKGSPYIRAAMYMPVGSILRHKSGPLYAYYQRLLSRHNIKMKAHVALQKKLLGYMYFLWRKNEDFDPSVIYTQQRQHGHIKTAPPEGEAAVDTSSAIAN